MSRILPQKITSKVDPELAQVVTDMLAELRRLRPMSSATVGVNQMANGFTLTAKVNPPGGSAKGILTYRGTYDAGFTYNQFDIVRVQTGTSQGIWICVSTTPIFNKPPVFPEPITTGGTNLWDMFNFGVQASVTCQGANSVVFINASAPLI